MAVASLPPGEIIADACYTLDDIKARTGLGVAALRQARRAGLKVKYIGRKGYILGADFLEFVRNHGKDEK